MPTRSDPLRQFRFRVEIGGITQAGFQEVSGPSTQTDPVDYREGTDPPHVRKLSGLTKTGALTLKWGLSASTELFDWRRQVVAGKLGEARRTVYVVGLDDEGNEAVRWRLENAWPSKLDGPALNAKGNDVAIETIEITAETMDRQK